MLRNFLKSKIHQATVTQAELYYEGSLTIDIELMEKADIRPYEKVSVVDINNGERFETYVIPGKRGTGVMCVNGAAARLVSVGDLIIVMSYCQLNAEEIENYKPLVVLLDKENHIKQISHLITNELGE
ncbi:MAG: aspartate 1-decarboxylase [Desulfobulbaceae bacterium]|nr:aspartate 1-decarboxylase [Candidatus Kapabacteria bacterium]MBS3999087.1 aspartate 1-decarboxylase [Desulfobulbaceae bacterium]